MTTDPTGPVDVWLVNADPLSGEPAVLGEVHPMSPPGTGPPSRPAGPGADIEELRTTRPDLYRTCTQAVAGMRTPSEVVVRAPGGGVGTVVAVRPLTLEPQAALRFATDLLGRGSIDGRAVLQQLPPSALDEQPVVLDRGRNPRLSLLTKGTPISGGPATGVLVLDNGARPESSVTDSRTIVVVDRVEATHTQLVDDPACAGLMAVRGSPVDHFAMIARDRGFGYLALPGHRVDELRLRWATGELRDGDRVTVDFATGEVYAGTAVLEPATAGSPRRAVVEQLLTRCPCPVSIRANVDTADDLPDRLPPTADGIGLVRTEHLLRRHGADELLRAVLKGGPDAEPPEALSRIGSLLQVQLERLLRAADGRPVTIRLLDYPLHELGGVLAGEVNPMLGLRGVRQGVRWPELYRAQLLALLRATTAVSLAAKAAVPVQILVPLVVCAAEVTLVREWLDECNDQLGDTGPVPGLGVMIETPAAVLAVEALARKSDVLSFGTNDLTQFVLGLSREDYVPVFQAYRRAGLVEDDPFATLPDCVLALLASAARRARKAHPGVTIGCCGAHAADPAVLQLGVGGLLDHVSVPLGALASTRLRALQSTDSRGKRAREGRSW